MTHANSWRIKITSSFPQSHDRDTKYTKSFQAILEAGQVKPVKLSARSPNLNAFAERWVRSVKEECLAKLILFGEASLRRALDNYMQNYHEERNHQGKSNVLLFPQKVKPRADSSIECSERLGGLRLDILPSRNVQCMALESFADHSLQADSSFLNDLLVACRLRADERRRLCVRHHQR